MVLTLDDTNARNLSIAPHPAHEQFDQPIWQHILIFVVMQIQDRARLKEGDVGNDAAFGDDDRNTEHIAAAHGRRIK